ncbi:ubiquinol-cytochrome c reductase cytochrome b subunit, partial [Streptomyces sp. MBT65]|nr:ubiquinol-cytochrome c reductase cytochrome b subunit [Streptomyces sp. MBT65]
PNPDRRRQALRHRLSRWLYGNQIAKPTPQEMREALAHPGHAALDAPAASNGHATTPNGHGPTASVSASASASASADSGVRRGGAGEREADQELH